MTVHESPRSVELKTWLPRDEERAPDPFGENDHRRVPLPSGNVSPFAGAGVTFSGAGRMLFDSPVTLFAALHVAVLRLRVNDVRVVRVGDRRRSRRRRGRSGTSRRSGFRRPSRVALGPHQS